MSKNLTNRTACLIGLALLVGLAVLAGCNRRSIDGPGGDLDYSWVGYMVKDYNLNRFEVTGQLATESGGSVSDATVKLNDDFLTYDSGSYSFEVDPATLILPGVYLLSLADSSGLDASMSATLPGSFNVTVTDPANRINNGGDQVSVDWSPALYSQGYVLTTVPGDSAYQGQGYTSWVTDQVTSGTIPPEAFRWSDGINPDTGWYYIYVYAYTDVPDSSLSDSDLPCPLPGQLTDNIDATDLVGHFGGVTVAPYDSVRVAIQ